MADFAQPESESQVHCTRLAEMLLAYPTVVLSGERLARELGVSRSTVWEGMRTLRAYGVQLEGHRGAGYRLLALPDLLLPSLVEPRLDTRVFGRPLHHAFRLASTQSAALAAAADPHQPAAEGELFVAETQTAGRGRHGHSWESPPGAGIYASLVLRPPGPPAGLLPLTLLAGLAVADAVADVTSLQPELRWPNDLLLDGGKFCGLLLEMSAEATRIHHAVLGFGVNVAHREFSPGLAASATSLDDALAAASAGGARRVSRTRLLAAVLGALERRYFAWREQGAAPTLAEFERRSRYARGLAVRLGERETALEGVTDGLDPNGFLRLRLPNGAIHLIVSGDVRPR